MKDTVQNTYTEPELIDFSTAPKLEDYPTIQEWNDAYWEWAKQDMHKHIDNIWKERFE